MDEPLFIVGFQTKTCTQTHRQVKQYCSFLFAVNEA